MDWYAWIDGGSDQLTAGRHVAAVDENDPPPRGWQEATRRGFGATLVDAKAALDCDIEEWIAIHASSPTTMLTEDLRALTLEASAMTGVPLAIATLGWSGTAFNSSIACWRPAAASSNNPAPQCRMPCINRPHPSTSGSPPSLPTRTTSRI